MSSPWKDVSSTADRETTEELLNRLPKGTLLLGYQGRVVDELYSGVSLLAIDKSRRIGLTWGVAFVEALSFLQQRENRSFDRLRTTPSWVEMMTTWPPQMRNAIAALITSARSLWNAASSQQKMQPHHQPERVRPSERNHMR